MPTDATPLPPGQAQEPSATSAPSSAPSGGFSVPQSAPSDLNVDQEVSDATPTSTPAPAAQSATMPTGPVPSTPATIPMPAPAANIESDDFHVVEPDAQPEVVTPAPPVTPGESFEVAPPTLDRQIELQKLNGYNDAESALAASGKHQEAYTAKLARVLNEGNQSLTSIRHAMQTSDVRASIAGMEVEHMSHPAEKLVSGDPFVAGPNHKIISGYGTAHLRGVLNHHIAADYSHPDKQRGKMFKSLMATIGDSEITAKQRAINFDFAQVIAGEVMMARRDKIGEEAWKKMYPETQVAEMREALQDAGIDPAVALKAKGLGEFFRSSGDTLASLGDLIPVADQINGTNRANDQLVVAQAKQALAAGLADPFQKELALQAYAKDLVNETRGRTLGAGVAGVVKGTIPFFLGMGATKPIATAIEAGLEKAVSRLAVKGIAKTAVSIATKAASAGAGYTPLAAASSIVKAEMRHEESAQTGRVESFTKALIKETASQSIDAAAAELSTPLKGVLGSIFKTAFKYGGKKLPAEFVKAASSFAEQFAKASAKTRLPFVKAALAEVGFNGPVNIATMEAAKGAKAALGIEDYHRTTGQDLLEQIIGFSIPGVTEHVIGAGVMGYAKAVEKYHAAKAEKGARAIDADKIAQFIAQAKHEAGLRAQEPAPAKMAPTASPIEAQKESVAHAFKDKEEFMSPEGLAAATVIAPDMVDKIAQPDMQPSRKVMPGNGAEGWRFTNEERGEVQKQLGELADAQKKDAEFREAVEKAKDELHTREMPIKDIHVDPARFQFKIGADAETGASELLKEVQVFRKEKAGVILVWKDPADGKFYVINGHHRVELAKRMGETSMNVMQVPAKNASEARLIGAEVNIAEGRGTALDAAKVIREAGMTREQMEKAGISMSESKAREGLALSKLSDGLFSDVAQGRMSVGRGIAIGEHLADHEAQDQLAKTIAAKEKENGEKITNSKISELARFAASAPSEQVSLGAGLFGEDYITKNLMMEKAELSDSIKRMLSQDKRLFGVISKQRNADIMKRGGNVIAVDENKAISEAARNAEYIYNLHSTRKGPVSEALNEAAKELAAGVKKEKILPALYQKVSDAVQEIEYGLFEGAKAEPKATDEGERSMVRNSPGIPPPVPTPIPSGNAGQNYAGSMNLSMKPAPGYPKNATPVGAADVVRVAARALDQVVFSGKMFGKKAIGQYNTASDKTTITTANTSDIGVAFHEFFHGVDRNTYMLTKMPKNARKEIARLDYDKERAKPRDFEGFAEYWRIRLTQGENAAEKASPIAHAYINRWLAHESPAHQKIKEAVDSVNTIFAKYRDQGAIKRAEGGMAHDKEGVVGKAKAALAAASELPLAPRGFITGKIGDFLTDTYQNMFHRNYAIRRAENAMGIAPRENSRTTAYELAENLYPNVAAQAQEFVHKGVSSIRDGKRVIIGPSLMDALAGMGPKELEDFNTYLVQKQVQEMIPKGHATAGYDLPSVNAAVEHFEKEYPEFVERAEKYREFNRALVKSLADAGVVKPERYEDIVGKFKYYASLARDMSTTFDTGLEPKGKGGSGAGGSPIIRRSEKGSGAKVKSPILSALDFASKVSAAIARKRVADALFESMDKADADVKEAMKSKGKIPMPTHSYGEFIHELPMEMKVQKFATKDAVEAFVNLGVPREVFHAAGVGEAGADGEYTYDPAELVKFTGDWNSYGEAENVLRREKGDSVEFYRVAPRVYEAVTNAAYINFFSHPALKWSVGMILKMWSQSIHFFAIHGKVAFAPTHGANVYSSSSVGSSKTNVAERMTDQFRFVAPALFDELKGHAGFEPSNPYYRAAVDAKLKNATYLPTDILTGRTRQLRKMMAADSTSAKVKNMFTHPLDIASRVTHTLGTITSALDMASRLPEFKKTLEEHGYDEPRLRAMQEAGEPLPENVLVHAMLDAADVGANYSRKGRYGDMINLLWPLANAHIQSTEHSVRKIYESKESKEKAFSMLATVSVVAAAAAAYWYTQKDKDYWKELPGFMKVRGMTIPDKDGNAMFFVPFGKGVFSTVAALTIGTLDAAYAKDKDALKEAGKRTAENALPAFVPTNSLNWIPGAAKPIIEDLANWNSYAERPIVAPHLRDTLNPQYEIDSRSSAWAKWLGKTFHESPKMIDHLSDAWTAGAFTGGGEKQFIPLHNPGEFMKGPNLVYQQALVLSIAQDVAKKENMKLPHDAAAEVARYEFAKEVMGAMRKAAIADDVNKDDKIALGHAQAGYARSVLGEPALARFKNPFMKDSAIPGEVRDQLDDFVRKEIRAAIKEDPGAPKKHPHGKMRKASEVKSEEDMQQAHDDWAAKRDGALRALRDTGLTHDALREIMVDGKPIPVSEFHKIQAVMNLPLGGVDEVKK